MTQFTRIRPVLPQRGAVSRFNDNTMEYLIALARFTGFLAAVAALGSLVGLIWTDNYRWALSAALMAVISAVASWFGFITNANEEWKHDTTQ
jgi:uncharacterized membrane protein YqjE